MSDLPRKQFNIANSPKATGYRWPAEWESHDSTWLTWPHNASTWPGVFEKIPTAYSQVVEAIASFEPVNMIVPPTLYGQVQAIMNQLDLQHHVKCWAIESNDAWTRDHGPHFLVAPTRNELAAVDWVYNAWGEKYPPFEADNAIPAKLAKLLGIKCFAPEVILELGSIDGNGDGVILTTESCLLDEHRNPWRDKSEAEHYLRAFACADEVLWLPGDGIPGDDTDGHIDQMARFVSKDRIVIAAPPAGAEFDRLRQNRSCLKALCKGRFDIIDLPLPEPRFHFQQRLPVSYCNFYVVNGGVLVPTFDDRSDQIAMSIIGELFPGRKIVPVDCTRLVVGLGNVHCLTIQQPKTGQQV